MKRYRKGLLLFLGSFVAGVLISPVYMTQDEPVSKPVQKPVEQQRNKLGESIRRIA